MGLIGRGEGWIAMPDNTDARWLTSDVEAEEYRAHDFWFVDGPIISAEWVEQVRGWLGLAQGAATPERAQEYISKALAALGGE